MEHKVLAKNNITDNICYIRCVQTVQILDIVMWVKDKVWEELTIATFWIAPISQTVTFLAGSI